MAGNKIYVVGSILQSSRERVRFRQSNLSAYCLRNLRCNFGAGYQLISNCMQLLAQSDQSNAWSTVNTNIYLHDKKLTGFYLRSILSRDLNPTSNFHYLTCVCRQYKVRDYYLSFLKGGGCRSTDNREKQNLFSLTIFV